MPDILQEARISYFCNRIGLLSDNDLIAWADRKIIEIDDPPLFIIELSLGKTPEYFSIVERSITTHDCSALMKVLSEKFDLSQVDIDQLGAYCYKLALISNGRSSDLLHWISDEIHLCQQGVKALDDSLHLIKEAMDEVMQSPPNE